LVAPTLLTFKALPPLAAVPLPAPAVVFAPAAALDAAADSVPAADPTAGFDALQPAAVALGGIT